MGLHYTIFDLEAFAILDPFTTAMYRSFFDLFIMVILYYLKLPMLVIYFVTL